MEETTKVIVIGVVTGTMFLLLFTLIMMMVLINYQRRKKKLEYEKKVLEARFEQELLQTQLEMQEHTLKAVSQEIHDNVGQILSLAKVNLNILTMEGGHDPRVADTAALVGKAIRELRDISTGYFADTLVEEGLVSAIRRELIQLEKTGMFSTSFHTYKAQLIIDKTKTIFLYRMFQEICNNIIKHAQATEISVTVTENSGQTIIAIHDNGIGFDESDDTFKTGMGLISIRQRAAMIGAQAEIESITGKGTTIQLTFNETTHDKSSFS